MAIPNPDHYLDQASKLAASPGGGGAPRQADLRRAISAAYYALFHAVAAYAADLIVGDDSTLFSLVYRGIDHKTIREVANDLTKSPLPKKYDSYAPPGGFGTDITDFAAAIYEMQEKRHKADYDPLARMTRSDVLVAIQTGRAALARFRGANAEHRRAFLFLLLFRSR